MKTQSLKDLYDEIEARYSDKGALPIVGVLWMEQEGNDFHRYSSLAYLIGTTSTGFRFVSTFKLPDMENGGEYTYEEEDYWTLEAEEIISISVLNPVYNWDIQYTFQKEKEDDDLCGSAGL